MGVRRLVGLTDLPQKMEPQTKNGKFNQWKSETGLDRVDDCGMAGNKTTGASYADQAITIHISYSMWTMS